MDAKWQPLAMDREQLKDLLLLRCTESLQVLSTDLDNERRACSVLKHKMVSSPRALTSCPDISQFFSIRRTEASLKPERRENQSAGRPHSLQSELTTFSNEQSALWDKYQLTLSQLHASFRENEALRASLTRETENRKRLEKRLQATSVVLRPIPPATPVSPSHRAALYRLETDLQATARDLAATVSLLESTQRELATARASHQVEVDTLRDCVARLESRVGTITRELGVKEAVVQEKEREIELVKDGFEVEKRRLGSEHAEAVLALEGKIRRMEAYREADRDKSQQDLLTLKDKLTQLMSTSSSPGSHKDSLPHLFTNDLESRLSSLSDRLQARNESFSMRKSLQSERTEGDSMRLLGEVKDFAAKFKLERRSVT